MAGGFARWGGVGGIEWGGGGEIRLEKGVGASWNLGATHRV